MHAEDQARQRPAWCTEDVVHRRRARRSERRHVERALAEADDDHALAIEARKIANITFGHDDTGEVRFTGEMRTVFALGVRADRHHEVIEVLEAFTGAALHA